MKINYNSKEYWEGWNKYWWEEYPRKIREEKEFTRFGKIFLPLAYIFILLVFLPPICKEGLGWFHISVATIFFGLLGFLCSIPFLGSTKESK